MGKRELVALLNLSSWCIMMVEWLFFAVPWGCLRFVVVVFPDHTHLLFHIMNFVKNFLSSITARVTFVHRLLLIPLWDFLYLVL